LFSRLKYFLLRKYLNLKYYDKEILIENNVKLNLSTIFEDHIKVYRNAEVMGSQIGRGSYIGWNGIYNNVKVGRFCSIGPFSEVIYGKHPSTMISTHPAFYSTQKQAGFTFTNKQEFNEYSIKSSGYSVEIGNDVWIGYGASIMEGVTIADGSIIGAKSLVTKDTEPYSINVGFPTKMVSKRFEDDQIKSLERLQWWNKDFEYIEKHKKAFLVCYDEFTTLFF